MSKDQLNQSSFTEEDDSSSKYDDYTQTVLNYVNDVLMEEDLEDPTCVILDTLALQATNKSLYDALGQDDPPLLDPSPPGSSSCVPEDGSNEESKQLMMLDNSFLSMVGYSNDNSPICPLDDASRNKASEQFQHDEQRLSSRIMGLKNKGEVVDFWTLLTKCADAVARGDQVTTNQLLEQIRRFSSPFGSGNQRLAHYFANGLDSRLAGTENITCVPTVGSSTRAADILKAYRMYASVCPFRKMSNTFTSRTIVELAGLATKIHIIDFGIHYGFQWPCFFQRVSSRPGGPPKIRITGIDFPQPGSKPAKRIEQTGCRLKRVAERFKVEFEYRAIAQRWESIQYEDIQIDRDEFTAVTCMYRLKNLPDDTVLPDCPRDVVLRLIKRINPNVFVHGITNGTYNSPFFTTRFRGALSYYSALFDILEATVPREDPERLVFEREMIGKATMNVIACEGATRVERPETYKQWQNRNRRIGFRQLPLHRGIMERVRNILLEYHKSFVVDEDGSWVLLGWKGRIVHAISAWQPVQD